VSQLALALPDTTRREFVRRETEALGRFLGDNEGTLVGWSRAYRCGCGFACRAPGDIYDHALTCKERSDT
jgi:hypothetical protein